MRIRRLAVFGAIAVILGTTAGVASATTASPGSSSSGPSVYTTQVVGSPIPLAKSNKVVLTSPALPAGNFLVTFACDPAIGARDELGLLAPR
jgi:hypothetical protein